ncbi:MAG: hypothetical protein GY764_10620 [Halieaceae bacterium]|nr:hypothetical protein [Halieaceae bacterium]
MLKSPRIKHVALLLLILARVSVAQQTNISVNGNQLTAADQAPSISLDLPDGAHAVHQRIARVFESQLYQRCGARVQRGTGGEVVVELEIGSGGAEDGYTISDRPEGGVLITGNNHRGLLYGVGKFLRSSQYEDAESNATFIPGDWRGSSAPVQAHRAVYWWTHIGPRWRNAQLENIRIDVEEMGLWGANVIAGCFPVQGGYGSIPGYSGFDDPKLAGLLLRMETMMKTAKELGLKTCLFIAPNTAYSGAPKSILATPHQNKCGGNHGVNVCPSTPEGERYLLEQWEGVLKHFKAIGVDELVFWPYDEGGCACERCRPWGGNGFLRISRAIKEMADTLYPGVKIALSTWCFDKDPSARNETEMLAQTLERDNSWVDYIMPDYRVPGYFPEKMIENGVPGNLPAINFAEISMKWHGWNNANRGLSPNPKKVAAMWALTKDKYKGGIIPYCEHIYTDADMVMMAQLSWAPERPASEVLWEYTKYEFSGAHTASIIDAIKQNEAGNTGQAAQILKSVEPKLTSYQRDSWRWRSFICKVTGASARAINYGVEPPRNRLGFVIPQNNTSTVASSELSWQYGAGNASDGILSSQDEENFWASAKHQDVGAWWQKDLRKKIPIAKVQIQFRGFDGRYHFVPKTISFQVSDDGKDWTTVVSKSADVPANNSPYTATMHTYGINAEGRYVRLLFEDGTEDTFGGFKVVELVEVKIIKAAVPGDSNDSARIRLPVDVPPVIGCWFPTAVDREPENFKPFLDHVAKHTAYNLLTTSIRIGSRYMSDQDVHDGFKAASAYARKRGIGIVPELGVWSSFNKAYPEETLNMVRLQTVDLAGEGEVIAKTGHRAGANMLQGWPFKIGPAKIARVYSYVRGAKGVDPGTVKDITSACKVREVTSTSITVAIPCNAGTRGRQACVLFEIPWQWPDPFNPHLPQHQRDHLRQYADVDLAGACLDEFGLPAFAKANELWCSPHWIGAYAERTKGRDLLCDMVLMVLGEKGRDAERYAAVNHYMEMTWQQIATVEEDFYKATKDIFGAAAFVGTHPTWQPHLNALEARRHGWDWWAVRRDYGQTDESTPYCVRTALAKKAGGPVGYNMYYSRRKTDYESELWANALAGFRVNYHPIYPSRRDNNRPYGGWDRKSLMEGRLMRGDCRVRMLNFISKTQVDCPVAVVFGHASALNWSGASYADAGDSLANAFWGTGFYADLIPTSEIENSALRVDEDGYVWYGNQKYEAVVLYHPEFERAGTGTFFRKAAKGKTALYQLGAWTRDFEGMAFDGKAALPPEMRLLSSSGEGVKQVTAVLRERGITPHTPVGRSGRCRLIDGTVILTAGAKNVAGDPIQKTIQVNGHDVSFDAVGVAAVRLAKDGALESMAAGGMKLFRVGDTTIELTQRADVALWKDEKGNWQGALQDCDGPLPEVLAAITKQWIRLAIPVPLSEDE